MTSHEWVDRDFYADLGIAADASTEDIKKAYRRLARQHHPDANPGDSHAEERFKAVSEAYQVLSDPETRAQYDHTRQLAAAGGPRASTGAAGWPGAGPRGAGPTAGESVFDLGDVFGTSGGMGMSDAQALFDSLFGPGTGTAPSGSRWRTAPPQGADLEAELTLDFRTAARGDTVSVQLGEQGTRRVRIPAGVADGQRLRLPGQGQPPATPRGKPGDLYVHLHIRPDGMFIRNGDDLTLTLPVTVPELVFGAEITVPTLNGTVALRVPADSRPGQTLRVRGRGITRPGHRPGDLLITLQAALPDRHGQPARDALAAYADATRDFDPRTHLHHDQHAAT